MNLSINLLNSGVLKSETANSSKKSWETLNSSKNKNGEIFFSTLLVQDSKYRIDQSKSILEETKRLKGQLEGSIFF